MLCNSLCNSAVGAREILSGGSDRNVLPAAGAAVLAPAPGGGGAPGARERGINLKCIRLNNNNFTAERS